MEYFTISFLKRQLLSNTLTTHFQNRKIPPQTIIRSHTHRGCILHLKRELHNIPLLPPLFTGNIFSIYTGIKILNVMRRIANNHTLNRELITRHQITK